MELSPSEVRRRLRGVVGEYDQNARLVLRQETLPLQQGVVDAPEAQKSDEPREPTGGWMRLRLRQGSVNRVPPGFYPRVWNLLRHCKGVIIGDKLELRNRLESDLILAETTAGEQSFANWVEHLLNKTDGAKYRQLNIEELTSLCSLVERNPELVFDDYLVVDVIIGHAVRLAWLDKMPDRSLSYDEDKSQAWKSFYESSPPAYDACIIRSVQFLTAPSQ